MTALHIQGNLRERFLQDAILLYTLDPVRGEPSAYSLDQDPFELEGNRERLLKRKFLDSIALICAVRRDRDAVSAACLEEGMPAGTVLRIASNSGVSHSTLDQLRGVIEILNNVASGAVNVSDVRVDVLLKIIQLDMMKIQGYIGFLHHANGFSEQSISDIESRFRESVAETLLPSPQDFLDWFENIFSIRSVPPRWDPEIVAKHIVWAQKAKYNYIGFLKVAFPWRDQPPPWISAIFKLGRYGIASKAILQLPTEFPAMFNPMTVEAVPAPQKTRSCTGSDALPLSCVLKRVVNDRADNVKPQLARLWNTPDAEDFFRKSCTFDSIVHAELQLLSFYDNYPRLKPAFRFIGVSKKTCYLCYMFLRRHPENFNVSSCHQKLYPAWNLPPAAKLQVYHQYKAIINDMSLEMEAIARRDLDTRLGIKRPSVADSTAGVSLGGLTDSAPSAVPIQDYKGTQVAPAMQQDRTIDGVETTLDNGPSERPYYSTEAVGPIPDTSELASVRSGKLERPDGGEKYEHNPFRTMVLHFVRSDDARKQDIILMNDIYDPTTKTLSWAKLVELLSIAAGIGLDFKEGHEYLLVNDHIRVANERQFLACLQYLLNTGVLTAKVYASSFS